MEQRPPFLQTFTNTSVISFQQFCDETRLIERGAYAWYEQQLMRRALLNWSIHVTAIRTWDWQLEDVAVAHWFR